MSAEEGQTQQEQGSELEAPQTGAEGSQGEPESFPRAVVEQLREEAAAARVKAKKADEYAERMRSLAIVAATRGVLADPTDLPYADDFDDETGLPDLSKITAAAEALVAAKPHLGRVRGDAGQGRHSEPHPAAVSLSALMRGGA